LNATANEYEAQPKKNERHQTTKKKKKKKKQRAHSELYLTQEGGKERERDKHSDEKWSPKGHRGHRILTQIFQLNEQQLDHAA
jgi:hypothetical protein